MRAFIDVPNFQTAAGVTGGLWFGLRATNGAFFWQVKTKTRQFCVV